MSTLQNTISMIEVLPETDLLKIQDFTKKLSKRHELEAADEAVGKFLPPKSREDIYRDLEISRQQAAISVTNDMEHTVERLSYMASGLKLCDNLRLRDLGYRTIHFKRHNYFMLYRIQDAIYHDLQNYEAIFQ